MQKVAAQVHVTLSNEEASRSKIRQSSPNRRFTISLENVPPSGFPGPAPGHEEILGAASHG